MFRYEILNSLSELLDPSTILASALSLIILNPTKLRLFRLVRRIMTLSNWVFFTCFNEHMICKLYTFYECFLSKLKKVASVISANANFRPDNRLKTYFEIFRFTPFSLWKLSFDRKSRMMPRQSHGNFVNVVDRVTICIFCCCDGGKLSVFSTLRGFEEAKDFDEFVIWLKTRFLLWSKLTCCCWGGGYCAVTAYPGG